MQMENRPKVGIGVIIIKDNKILLGKRRNAHGEGSWCYPGGHLEFGESWEECSRREVREEVGIEIKNLRFGTITNDIFKNEHKHYITISMISDFESGEVTLMEPDKCDKWEWFEWDNLPSPLFLPTINQLKEGFKPF
jgi:8-oxo-dGTP diphosphatase